MNHFLELLPVVLAFLAAILCAHRFRTTQSKHRKRILIMGVMCAFMLIVAQASWWGTYLLEGGLEGTTFANHVWTIFNSLVMVSFIAFAYEDS